MYEGADQIETERIIAIVDNEEQNEKNKADPNFDGIIIDI
jgi:hypothetical protein